MRALLRQIETQEIRRSFRLWCDYALKPLGQKPAAHHLLLIDRLQDVAEGRIDRLMVMMPPGSAKSTYASVLFPAWFMQFEPGAQMIGASHTATLAEDFSRRVIRTASEHRAMLGYHPTNEAGGLWYGSNRSRFLAAGVGGAITGSRADVALVDDPVKSLEDADSQRIRDVAHGWYRADLTTRMKPGGRCVIIMTRWHEDDLAGRLLNDEPDRWTVLKLPALAEANDPLGRAIGAPLWPEWETGAMLYDKRRTLGEREWAALFQQSPRTPDGALFKVAQIAAMPASVPGKTIRAWDLAATKALGTRDPDWTAGVRMTRTSDGRFVVDDVVRLRGSPDEVEATIVATASRDGRGIEIKLPQDPGQAGKAQVLYLTRKLAGYRVHSQPVTGEKSTRAAPLAAQVNVGNVSVVQAAWNRVFLDELAGFPSGAHDDQVDAAADAFSGLIAPPEPARIERFNVMAR